jgi:hypothetical protein
LKRIGLTQLSSLCFRWPWKLAPASKTYAREHDAFFITQKKAMGVDALTLPFEWCLSQSTASGREVRSARKWTPLNKTS